MTLYEVLNTLVQIVALLVIPASLAIFMSIQNLKVRQVELSGELQNNKDRIDHIHANYKMGIEHLNERMTRLESDISELKNDIKQIMKFIYSHNDNPA